METGPSICSSAGSEDGVRACIAVINGQQDSLYSDVEIQDLVDRLPEGIEVSVFKNEAYDVVLLDTAGRLQIDEAMMEELVLIKEAAPPDEILLVADAMTGQNAVDIAKESSDIGIGLKSPVSQLVMISMSSRRAALVAGVARSELAPVRVIEQGPVRTIVEALFECGDSTLSLRYTLPARGSEVEIDARLYWMEKDRLTGSASAAKEKNFGKGENYVLPQYVELTRSPDQ
jgi:hypothetical protein